MLSMDLPVTDKSRWLVVVIGLQCPKSIFQSLKFAEIGQNLSFIFLMVYHRNTVHNGHVHCKILSSIGIEDRWEIDIMSGAELDFTLHNGCPDAGTKMGPTQSKMEFATRQFRKRYLSVGTGA